MSRQRGERVKEKSLMPEALCCHLRVLPEGGTLWGVTLQSVQQSSLARRRWWERVAFFSDAVSPQVDGPSGSSPQERP